MNDDPFRWLEDLDSAEAAAFVNEHERRSRTFLDAVTARDALRSLLERKVASQATQDLGGGFFLETRVGVDGPDLVRRNPGREPVVLLTALDGGEAPLVFATPSPTGRHVALGRADGGPHYARISILDVVTGEVLPARLPNRFHEYVSWLPDGSGFYYSACPDDVNGEHWKSVYLYQLREPDRSARVFGDDIKRDYWCRAEVSECGRFVLFYKFDFVHANDVSLQRLGEADLKPIAAGMRSLSWAQVIGDQLLIRTDLDAPRGRCCLASVDTPDEWRTIIPEGEHVLQTVTGAGGRLYAVWARGGHHAVTVHGLDGAVLREVQLPTLGSINHHNGAEVVSGVSGSWAGDEVRVRFQSVLHPPSVYRYDSNADRLMTADGPDYHFAAEDYISEQIHYPSADGTMVPMLLVRHRHAPRDGQQPVRLTGYGGFGIPFESRWSAATAAWLEMGGMLAFAGIRGGGEYGKAWWDAARGRHRQRAFDDYIAAARWLVSAGWTEPARLVSRGNSNGGLMVAVTAMQAPDAFGAVISRAALLNMLEFPRFGYLASATVEYGSPDDPEDAAYLAGYSPYHNVRPYAPYPPMLFIAAMEDGTSPPYDPMKMVARLEAEATPGGPYWLLPLRASGHHGGATAAEAIAQDLDELCLCWWAAHRQQPGASG